jgi:hypothetical protein
MSLYRKKVGTATSADLRNFNLVSFSQQNNAGGDEVHCYHSSAGLLVAGSTVSKYDLFGLLLFAFSSSLLHLEESYAVKPSPYI